MPANFGTSPRGVTTPSAMQSPSSMGGQFDPSRLIMMLLRMGYGRGGGFGGGRIQPQYTSMGDYQKDFPLSPGYSFEQVGGGGGGNGAPMSVTPIGSSSPIPDSQLFGMMMPRKMQKSDAPSDAVF